MQYIVQKPFYFAGDSYKPGDVFDPAKYPFVCDSAKLSRLVNTRRIMEDFKVCGKDVKQRASVNAETSSQDGFFAEEIKNPKRSKGGE